MPRTSNGWLVVVALAAASIAGCARIPNNFRETGPSVYGVWATPTAVDLADSVEPAEVRDRDWEPLVLWPESGAVVHGPLYFENPFIDKGAGRTDATHPGNVYRMGWEDFVAAPYGLARYTLNWIALPVSMIVQPPWMALVSDGELSKQALGYDHDARPVGDRPPPAITIPGVTRYEMPREYPADDEPPLPPPAIDEAPAEEEAAEPEAVS